MTDEQWARVKALFHSAAERPAAERDAFLAAAAADDETVRREVESLLASDAANVAAVDEWSLAGEAVGPDVRIAIAASMTEMERSVVLSVGSRIASYEVISLLGAGAMGDVYRARDTKLNRDVALKVLPRPFALDPDRLARFRREAHVLAALNHPNIAAIYGFEESDGVQALVLELVEGPTLADRVARGPLGVEEVLGVGRQIADAVDAAHQKGIIHRDLKPANIKVAGNGVVKVLDFGLAKAWERTPDADLSASPNVTATLGGERLILGTAAYMSPEQARGRTLDKRTDIWSFGCVLFEMLTGRAAFAAETISDTIARILEREVDWQALPRSTPPRLRDLLGRCLQKDANRRLRDIGDARLELDEVSTARVVQNSDAGVDAALPNERGRRLGGLWPFVGTGAFVILAALGGATFSGRSRGASTPTFRELTFRHGTITGARLAPDGQTVVYGATWMGAQPQLYVIRPESPQSGPLGLGNAGIYSVSSPGDLAVALGCRLNWGECLGTLAQVPMTGGSPRELRKDVLGADWSPDGQHIAVVSSSGDGYRLEYPIGNVIYQPSGWITFARVSPRADRIAFLDHAQLGDTGGSVAVVDLSGKKTTLSSDWKSLQGLAWSADGEEIWFSGSRTGKGGTSALYAVTLSGRERMVFSSPSTLKLNDISRDGQRILLTRGTTRGGISFGVEGSKERDLSWFDFSTVADLSPDGKTILFYEWGEGVAAKSTVFVRKSDGSDAVRLGEGRPLALSPDGQWALAVEGETQQRLVLLPIGPHEAKRMPRGPIIEYLDWGVWSPDGRRILFAGRESPDVRRTYVQDVEGGDPQAITPDGFIGMLLSPNGRTIAAVDRYGEYYLCSADQRTEPRPLAGYRDGDVPLQWSADGRFLFVREAGNLVLRLYKLDLSNGTRQFWQELSAPDPAVLVDIGSDPGQIRMTPDGKSYVYTYWTFEGELYLAQGLK